VPAVIGATDGKSEVVSEWLEGEWLEGEVILWVVVMIVVVVVALGLGRECQTEGLRNREMPAEYSHGPEDESCDKTQVHRPVLAR
jgi:hypothetical protein